MAEGWKMRVTLSLLACVIGTAADELNSNNLQDATLLYDDPRVDGPTSRTDAPIIWPAIRHNSLELAALDED